MEDNRYLLVYRFIRTGGTEDLIVKVASQIQKCVSIDVHCLCEECSYELQMKLKKRGINVDEVSWNYINQYVKCMLSDKELRIITFEWRTFIDFFMAEGLGKKTVLYVVHPECIKGDECIGRDDYFHKDLAVYEKNEAASALNNLILAGHIVVMDRIIKSETELFYRSRLDMPIVRICVDIIDDWETVSESISRRYHGKKVVAAARAEFPFKGYILGLLRWAETHLLENNLKMEIISYGKDYHRIVSEYEKMSESLRNNIKITAKATYEELREILSECFLYVGMGTSVIDAAEMGIPVIPIKPNEYELKCNNRFDANLGEVCAGDMYEYCDFNDLVQTVCQMDISEYTEISRNTFDVIRRLYDSKKITEDIVRVLDFCTEDCKTRKDELVDMEGIGTNALRKMIDVFNNMFNGRKIVIYGAGIGGRELYFKLLEIGIQSDYFVDKDYLHYAEVYGIPVKCPDLLDVNLDYVFISPKKFFSEIVKSLESVGYEWKKDYLYPHVDLVKDVKI